jgi:hypothetical protein
METALQLKAKPLLGIGLPHNIVAAAIGASEGLISQWFGDEAFAKEIADLRATHAAEAVSRDLKYNSLEDQILEKLEEKMQMIWDKKELLGALRIVNSAVRRGSPQELGGKTQIQVVQLQLPESGAFAARFVLNSQNQVVEIAGRSLATMNAKGVVQKLEEMKKAQEKNEKVVRDDAQAAQDRLRNLQSLTHLPVAEVL